MTRGRRIKICGLVKKEVEKRLLHKLRSKNSNVDTSLDVQSWCSKSDGKCAVESVECCECVVETEQRMLSDQNGKFWQYKDNLFLTFWIAESPGEAVIKVGNEKLSREKKTQQPYLTIAG